MHIKNTHSNYGIVSISLHWIVAIVIVGLYCLGWYMVGLDYYNPYYTTLPFIHKSVGLLLAMVIVARLLWRLLNPSPASLETHSKTEKKLAHGVHFLLYVIIMAVMFSGYLISTADGRPISVFGWFDVPALPALINNQEDVAGFWHFWIATGLLVLAGIHALAAIKHHFIDKDKTLVRMMKPHS